MPSTDVNEAVPRRLLLVSHRPLEYGGTTRWRRLAAELPRHGWELIAVTPPPSLTGDQASSDPRVARWSEVRARVTGRVGSLGRPVVNRLGFQPEAFPPNVLWSFTGRRAIREALLRHAPHVVVATSPPPAALFASAAVVPPGLPFVADLRDPWAGSPFYDNGGRLLTAIERRALCRADAIVAVTSPMLEQLQSRHPALAGRMRLLPNGYDPRLLELREPRPPAAPDGKLRLVHPGTLYGERTLAAVIEAASAPELRSRVALELIGNVNASTAAAIRRADPALEVTISPPLPWEAAIERVRAADAVVVVQPAALGDDIAWPVKALEALALGKPMLAVTSGGALERLLRELGQPEGLAREGDLESVRAAILRLLAAPPAPVDPVLLGSWDRNRVASDYAELLDELAGSTPEAPQLRTSSLAQSSGNR